MRPLVLVHGFMGGSGQWDLQRDALGAGRRLVTVDLPGFAGNNQAHAPDTIEGFARFVLDSVEALGIESFDLLGHSMGGMIVQEMVALAPERIRRLVLYGTGPAGNLPGRFETFARSRERVEADGVESTANRISATWFLNQERALEYENCAAIARRSSLQALHAGLTAMENWSGEHNLGRIACPVRIIWGEADRTYRWPQTEALWHGIKGASLAVVPGCAHAVHMEKPAIFNALVADFMDLA